MVIPALACVYVICACVCAHVCVCARVCISTRVCVLHLRVCMYMCVCTYVCTHQGCRKRFYSGQAIPKEESEIIRICKIIATSCNSTTNVSSLIANYQFLGNFRDSKTGMTWMLQIKYIVLAQAFSYSVYAPASDNTLH